MGSPTQRKGGLRLAAAVALLLAAAPPLHAQGTGTVRGTVVDAANRQPLAGASVSVVGGTARTVTSAGGEYALAGVPEGRVRVRAAMLGHQPAEASVAVAAGQTARADFALAAAAVGLEAIVVTGTPGATSRRQLPNAITTLDVEEITAKTTVSDVAEVLQSRTPGVQILSNAGTPGAAPDIRIRGAGSLSAVRPIIYVDGIRYNDADLGNFGASGAGITSFSTQVTSALSFINPEDIESIEVIKGPAASTLYGAEAAAGVIQIITKKGTRGAQQTRWSARVEYGRNDMTADIPDNFTTCTQARIDQRDATTGQPVFPGCQGVPLNTVLRETSPILRDPFGLRAGDVRRMNLSVRGGSDRFSFFVAGDADDEEGVFFNSFNNRRSFRGNFTVNATSRLDFQVNTNYVRNHLRLPIGDESAQGLLLGSVRGLVGRIPAAAGVFPGYAFAVDGRRANGYNNQTRSDRTTLSSTVNYRPWDWFRNRLTVGLDLTGSQATIVSAAGSTDADFAGTPEGLSALRVPRSRFLTLDYAGNVELPVNDWLETTTSVGMQFIARRTETLSGTGTGLGAPDITTIQNAATTTGSNTFFENNSIGVYVQEQLAFNNRLFITGALRADDNSSFGRDFDAIIYPKLGFSWVLSEEPALARFLDPVHANQLKIRAAYGQAGRAPDPYSANQTYTVVKVAGPGATVSGLRTVAYGNPDLEPERGEEVELGFEAAFLGDRLGLDFTWYHKRTDNLLQSISVAPSSGFISTQLTNLGEISNRGIELLVTAYPVQRESMVWESRLNLATNRNRLVKLNDDGLQSTAAAFQAYFTGLQVMRVGRPLAAFYSPVAIADSFEVRTGITFPVLDTASYLGTPTPTREIGWGNTLTLGRVSLFAQLDYKGGHSVFNYKEYDRCRLRGNCEVANDPRVVAPASAADSAFARDASRFMGRGILNGVIVSYVEPYVEDADFLKLRDVSLSFSIPERLVARTGASGATLTLAGHNVATLWTKYSGIDPEVNTYGNRSFVRVDAYAAPQNRRLSASINFNF
ncbi:MAG TPA: SusC/RagA family TonB-linked outer membrane protein [Longimicrobium sp.]|nr:SusC/RagA family TonB-linked outer membrane protein [Longimicrobium sp.]